MKTSELQSIVDQHEFIKVHLTLPSNSGVAGENFHAKPIGVTQSKHVIAEVTNILFMTEVTTLHDLIEVRRGGEDECPWEFVKVIQKNRRHFIVKYKIDYPQINDESDDQNELKNRYAVTRDYLLIYNLCIQSIMAGYAAIAHPVSMKDYQIEQILNDIPENGLELIQSEE